MRKLAFRRGNLRRLRSVASVFVSRIDTAVDRLLDERIAAEADPKRKAAMKEMKGRAAVAVSRIIFQRAQEVFSGQEFKSLAKNGAHVQRILWGSTSSKNPAYSDIKYVTELIGSPTVNTMPEKTLQAFLDHGKPEAVLSAKVAAEWEALRQLRDFRLSIDRVGARLLEEGVAAFVNSFDSLLRSIEQKAKKLAGKHEARKPRKSAGKHEATKSGKKNQ